MQLLNRFSTRTVLVLTLALGGGLLGAGCNGSDDTNNTDGGSGGGNTGGSGGTGGVGGGTGGTGGVVDDGCIEFTACTKAGETCPNGFGGPDLTCKQLGLTQFAWVTMCETSNDCGEGTFCPKADYAEFGNVFASRDYCSQPPCGTLDLGNGQAIVNGEPWGECDLDGQLAEGETPSSKGYCLLEAISATETMGTCVKGTQQEYYGCDAFGSLPYKPEFTCADGLRCGGYTNARDDNDEVIRCNTTDDCGLGAACLEAIDGNNYCFIGYCLDDCNPSAEQPAEGHAGCKDPSGQCRPQYSDVTADPEPGICRAYCDVIDGEGCAAFPTAADTRDCYPFFDDEEWNLGVCFTKKPSKQLNDVCDPEATGGETCPIGAFCLEDPTKANSFKCLAVCDCGEGGFGDDCSATQCQTGETCTQKDPENDRLGVCVGK